MSSQLCHSLEHSTVLELCTSSHMSRSRGSKGMAGSPPRCNHD